MKHYVVGGLVMAMLAGCAGTMDAGAPADTVLRALPELRNGSELTADANFVSYGANGFLTNGGDQDVAAVATDVDLFEDATAQLHGDALAEAEHGGGHGGDTVFIYPGG